MAFDPQQTPKLHAFWEKLPATERTVLFGILHTCLIAYKLGPNGFHSGGTEEECRRQFGRLLPGERNVESAGQLPWDIAYLFEQHLEKNPSATALDLVIEAKKNFWARV